MPWFPIKELIGIQAFKLALSLFQHLRKASIYALLPFFLNERPLLLQAPSKQMLGFKLDASTGINLSLQTWF